MRRYFPLVLGLLATPAFADDLILHTGSYHGSHSTLNTTNPGLGYATDGGWVVGVYYNSYEKISLYGAKDFAVNRYAGAFVGVATGYEQISGQPLGFVGGLRLSIPLGDKWKANVLYAPSIGGSEAVWHLTLSYKL